MENSNKGVGAGKGGKSEELATLRMGGGDWGGGLGGNGVWGNLGRAVRKRERESGS